MDKKRWICLCIIFAAPDTSSQTQHCRAEHPTVMKPRRSSLRKKHSEQLKQTLNGFEYKCKQPQIGTLKIKVSKEQVKLGAVQNQNRSIL